MSDPPFYFSHIWNNATNSLSSDFLSCVLVSRHWYDSLISVLWPEHITFRWKPVKKPWTWTGEDYTLTPQGQFEPQKHAHHIRAVTCYATHALQVLSHASTITEINCLLDQDLSQDGDSG